MKPISLTIIFSLFIAITTIEAKDKTLTKAQLKKATLSPYVSAEIWSDVSEFLMPSDHKIKAKLDKIFKKARVTQNVNTLRAAGFEGVEIRKFSNMVVATHPKMPGYYFKMYLDEQNLNDSKLLLKRIRGAKSVQAAIDRHKFNKMFKVPKKWLYPIPENPAPAPGSFRKNFILIAEDSKLESKTTNKNFWKGRITQEQLRALSIIIREEGLNDSVYYFNVPLAKDGRLAFIDTEHHHNWPIYYEKTIPFLSPAMAAYWLELWK